MKKGTWGLIGGLAIAVGAFGAVLMKKNSTRGRGRGRDKSLDAWARPGMAVVFRAELMPGRDRAERTFHVKEVLPSGRVLLDRTGGEHAEKEFDPQR
jgi:hypothetical protein